MQSNRRDTARGIPGNPASKTRRQGSHARERGIGAPKVRHKPCRRIPSQLVKLIHYQVSGNIDI